MKRKSLVVLTIMMVFCIFGVADAVNPVKLIINGKEVTGNTSAQIINNSVMVPLRLVADNLDAKTAWNPATHTVTITSNHNQPRLLKVDGEQTTWPYWYEKEKLYLEYRNAVELIREANYSPQHAITYFPKSGTLAFDNKRLEMPLETRDGFKVISINYLRALDYLDYEFDPDQGNMIIISRNL